MSSIDRHDSLGLNFAQTRNPFPGLHSFGPAEDHLFFGREKQTRQLLRRLRTSRMIFVVGTSGCGKSSLVHCGLIPNLHSGFMLGAGSAWRVAFCRPGNDPIGNLATALNAQAVLGGDQGTGMGRLLQETTLRRSSAGLLDCVAIAQIPKSDNLLIVIDQFEELFRFKKRNQDTREEAAAFIKLLLTATDQYKIPLYIVVTMRSDFIGNCMAFPDLPHAINEGIYLVPRMDRDEIKAAITGPVAVAGGRIAGRLTTRLVNQVGNDPDQLPLLQHALMRLWDRWQRSGDRQIDLKHYRSGGMAGELSQHAEEVFCELEKKNLGQVTEKIFKALTEMDSENRGIRRPTQLSTLCEISGAAHRDVAAVVACFRRPEHSFLMPATNTPLTDRVFVDISHESLMRVWTRLRGWVAEESHSVASYSRISEAAELYQKGEAGLLRNPQLKHALKWQRENQPTQGWTRRFDKNYHLVKKFIDESQRVHHETIALNKRQRLLSLRRKRTLRLGLALTAVLVITTLFLGRAWFTEQRIKRSRDIAAASEQSASFLADLFKGIDPRLIEHGNVSGQEILDRGLVKLKTDLDLLPGVRLRLLEVIGRAYNGMGNYEQALWLRNEALSLRQDMGDPGPLVMAMVSLAETESELAQPLKAEFSAQKALELAKHTLGNSPEMAAALNAMGEILIAQGRYSQAEDPLGQALSLRQELLGPRHSLVGESTANFAALAYYQGDFDTAEKYFQTALVIYRESLGEAHPDVITLLSNLAVLHHQFKKDAVAAELLYRQVLALDRKRYGERHPFVATGIANLASLLHQQGDFIAAEPLYRQALTTRVSVLGENHPEVATDKANLASLLLDKGDFISAESLYRQALTTRLNILGSNHPLVADNHQALASVLQQKGDLEGAETRLRTALHSKRKSNAEASANLGLCLRNLADVLALKGCYTQAEPLINEAMALFQKSLPSNHRTFVVARSVQGRILAGLGCFAEVEEDMAQSYLFLRDTSNWNHHETNKALTRLIDAYELAGRNAEAEPWRSIQAAKTIPPKYETQTPTPSISTAQESQ